MKPEGIFKPMSLSNTDNKISKMIRQLLQHLNIGRCLAFYHPINTISHELGPYVHGGLVRFNQRERTCPVNVSAFPARRTLVGSPLEMTTSRNGGVQGLTVLCQATHRPQPSYLFHCAKRGLREGFWGCHDPG